MPGVRELYGRVTRCRWFRRWHPSSGFVALAIVIPVLFAALTPSEKSARVWGRPGSPAWEDRLSEASEEESRGQAPGSESGEQSRTGDSSCDERQREILQKALNARGVYVTMRTAGNPEFFLPLMAFVRETGLNALVIDVKDNAGYLPCAPPEDLPARHHGYTHFPALVALLREHGYYLIARIVAFQDPYLTSLQPDRAIRRPDGALWRDRGGMVWLNPYDIRNWEYIRDVCLWAKEMGFHEIQLDYVRFPDNLPRTQELVVMPDDRGLGSRTECIKSFLRFIDDALKDGDDPVLLSADVFGFTTLAEDDMGIGQRFEDICDVVDFISPMVYPSHYYNRGIYGFDVPEAHPYEMVDRALADAVRRSQGRRAKIRPWLQDFSLNVAYGPREVEAQIRATYEHEIFTWLLWNPANRYTGGVGYEPAGNAATGTDTASQASPRTYLSR